MGLEHGKLPEVTSTSAYRSIFVNATNPIFAHNQATETWPESQSLLPSSLCILPLCFLHQNGMSDLALSQNSFSYVFLIRTAMCSLNDPGSKRVEWLKGIGEAQFFTQSARSVFDKTGWKAFGHTKSGANWTSPFMEYDKPSPPLWLRADTYVKDHNTLKTLYHFLVSLAV
jgi:hypothetical protein